MAGEWFDKPWTHGSYEAEATGTMSTFGLPWVQAEESDVRQIHATGFFPTSWLRGAKPRSDAEIAAARAARPHPGMQKFRAKNSAGEWFEF